MCRIKTRHTGVYYRLSKKRADFLGKPDKCFDIHFKLHGKDIWEKVGWKSEGFNLKDAIDLRSIRIRALRHPELAAKKTHRNTTLYEMWLQYQEQWIPHLKAQKSMVFSFEKHVLPVFGKCEMQNIMSYDIESFKHDLLIKCSPANTKYILSILRRVLCKAKEWNFFPYGYEVPLKSFRVSNSDKKRERFLTPLEAGRILDGLQFYNCTLYYISKIALYTGMRLGEIVGLCGKDINVYAGLIKIDGKTGHRVAYMSDNIKNDILHILPSNSNIRIFEVLYGKKLTANAISERFAKFIEIAGFNEGVKDSSEKIVFHTFRHTFCSWLAMSSVPLLTIGQLVGHSSTSMTERYAKLSPDYKLEALKNIQKMLSM